MKELGGRNLPRLVVDASDSQIEPESHHLNLIATASFFRNFQTNSCLCTTHTVNVSNQLALQPRGFQIIALNLKIPKNPNNSKYMILIIIFIK
jgi:hypothetical protein